MACLDKNNGTIKALEKWLTKLSPRHLDAYIDICKKAEDRVLAKHGLDPKDPESMFVSLSPECMAEYEPIAELRWLAVTIRLNNQKWAIINEGYYVKGPGRY